ncbi:hypothetical protein CPB83DRAFT_844512 [Crepidotus variabilis]|uniref:Uncharacterized protein n=1 Tax=Crepidotus variabilis TaxID=179855 RepID=A0A9P6EQZ0_9AGAR|nr:hypothetical protein CPB83DRAFT_844512 [Crepidotus variabilis]
MSFHVWAISSLNRRPKGLRSFLRARSRSPQRLNQKCVLRNLKSAGVQSNCIRRCTIRLSHFQSEALKKSFWISVHLGLCLGVR